MQLEEEKNKYKKTLNTKQALYKIIENRQKHQNLICFKSGNKMNDLNNIIINKIINKIINRLDESEN